MAERRKIVWTRPEPTRVERVARLAPGGAPTPTPLRAPRGDDRLAALARDVATDVTLEVSEGERLDGELPHVRAPLREALLKRGAPRVEGATPREEAIQLLQLAAEIEHVLMVQYLYAAMSLASSARGGVGPWNALMTIAEQEMGHLISVQNLLLAIGGPDAIHFGRDGIRVTNPENPLPFVLEPVSRASLAKYLAVEMPAEVPAPLAAEIAPLLDIAAAQAATPHGVGAIYAKLFWLFQPTDAPTAPLNLTPAPSIGLDAGRHLSGPDFVDAAVRERFEAVRDDWIRGSAHQFVLEPVRDATDALALISAISKQGEGLEEVEASHFMEFVALARAFEAGQLTVDPLPRTPVASIAAPSDAGATTRIATPYGFAWAELFDLRYNLLVLDLWHAMASDRGAPARGTLIELAYTNMSLVKRLAQHLLERRGSPASEDGAPPFGLVDDGLPASGLARWQKHAALLERQSVVVARIRTSPEFATPGDGIIDFEGSLLVEDVATTDVTRKQLIDGNLQNN